MTCYLDGHASTGAESDHRNIGCRPRRKRGVKPNQWRCQVAELPPPEGIVLTHFIVSDDVERSRRFYTEVLGGRLAFSGPGGLTYIALANSWIIINVGGGPTDGKPAGILEPPRCALPDPAETAPVREALLHPRSRRPPDRSRADHRPRWRLVARSLAR